jgi:hypothetical protein
MSQERHGKVREIGLVSASFVCFSSFVPFVPVSLYPFVLLLLYSCFFVFVCVCLCSFFIPSFLSLSQDYFGPFNPTSFTSIQNQFQMKLMKVNYNMKDNMKEEFENEDEEEL